MITITSQDNKIYRLCVQLSQKKFRDRLGLYIVEGQKNVREALLSGRAQTVIMREDFPHAFQQEGAAFVFMTGSLFAKIAQTETSQGILAIVVENVMTRQEFLAQISAKNNSKVLVLDRLQDPGNIGTIIRTADAAGYAGIIVMKETGDHYAPKVVRAAASSLLRIPILKADNEADAISLLEEANKIIVGTTPVGGVPYTQADWSRGIGLIIGNEGSGLSEAFQVKTSFNVYIPMNKEVDSLNAAVAAGILIYESIKER